jgi:hypothetical protein
MDISNRRRQLDPLSAAREGEVRSIAGGRQLPIDPSRYLDPSSAARSSEVRSIMDPRYYLDSEYEQAKSYSKMIDPSSAARPSELRQVAEDPLMPDIDPRAVIRDDEYQRIIKNFLGRVDPGSVSREAEAALLGIRDPSVRRNIRNALDPGSIVREGEDMIREGVRLRDHGMKIAEYELAESYSKVIDPSSAARPSERRMLAGPYDQVIDPSSMKIRHGE